MSPIDSRKNRHTSRMLDEETGGYLREIETECLTETVAWQEGFELELKEPYSSAMVGVMLFNVLNNGYFGPTVQYRSIVQHFTPWAY